jgi:dolichyl-diphosphooligosaccharide--protein glycosyltransferase/undecaprenyl-diphosphooligosaccharide--protein glycosyltransferase
MNKNTTNIKIGTISIKHMIGLMLLAYAFSFAIRMIWVWQFQDNPNFIWNGQLMINTNDGYFFASGAQKELFGLHKDNPWVYGIWDYGIIFFTTLFTKITPFSLETVILYLPAVISSLVVIPIILISRLYKQTLWGFLAALLASIAWSYYNRTMIGYYDTDMFSAMAPMFILFFLMKSTIDLSLKSSLYAALSIALYPFLYDQGQSLIYAMGIMYALYMLFHHYKDNISYLSFILIFISLIPFPFPVPYTYMIKATVLVILYFILRKSHLEQKKLIFISGLLFLIFLFFGHVFELIFTKIFSYIATGTKTEGLHFYSVIQTVREAGQIPFSTFANRISGSQAGVLISLIGYSVLVLKHRAFILALPLVGIGVFALIGGLRFTVYAVPVAAISAIYLFFVLGDYFKDKKFKYLFITFATAMMISPNITHILAYKVPTVLNKTEVADLVKLNELADSKDYTLTWWDYGYPIWYYSDTSTLIDGGKHHNDNYVISQIMQTSSADLAINLSRLAVETYAKGASSRDFYDKHGKKEKDIPVTFKMLDNKGKVRHAGKGAVINVLLRNMQKDQLDPSLFLEELKSDTYLLPKATRDIYLYLPYRMLNIYPTLAVFGNLNLNTGKPERKIEFYPTNAIKNTKGIITFQNGIIFDSRKGNITLGKNKVHVKYFIVTQNTQKGKVQLQSQLYHADGKYAIVYMKSYNRFVVMDIETFNSMYVQMFMLEKYDHKLFELVISSPYSKIYKLKK